MTLDQERLHNAILKATYLINRTVMFGPTLQPSFDPNDFKIFVDPAKEQPEQIIIKTMKTEVTKNRVMDLEKAITEVLQKSFGWGQAFKFSTIHITDGIYEAEFSITKADSFKLVDALKEAMLKFEITKINAIYHDSSKFNPVNSRSMMLTVELYESNEYPEIVFS